MTELVLVKSADCLPLRALVLHPRKQPEACVSPEDDEERSLHFAVKKGKQVLGVLSLRHEQRAALGSEVWRVYDAAVIESARRQGVGRQLLLAAQAVVEQRGGGAWCEVPTEASPFFAAYGFHPLDEPGAGAKAAASRVMAWRPAP